MLRELCMLANKTKTFPFQWTVEIRDSSALWLIVKTLQSVLFYSALVWWLLIFPNEKRTNECEVCFKHTVFATYGTHRVVACAYFVNQCHYHPTVYFCCVRLWAMCCVCVCVCLDWIVFFPRAKMMKNVFVHKLAPECLYWSRKIHTCITVCTHTLCLPIDAWIKFQSDTIRVRPYN